MVTQLPPKALASRPVAADKHVRYPEVSIILPAFNEGGGLSYVLSSLFLIAPADWQVIVIDDGSTDDTAEVASMYPCQLIRHESNRGKGAAVRTGLEAALGRSAIVMDADGTYPVEALPEMVELLRTHDYVRGHRLAEPDSMPWLNWVGNRLFDFMLRAVHGLQGDDLL